MLSMPGAPNPGYICPEALARAGKIQGGGAVTEVSLFNFPTQI